MVVVVFMISDKMNARTAIAKLIREALALINKGEYYLGPIAYDLDTDSQLREMLKLPENRDLGPLADFLDTWADAEFHGIPRIGDPRFDVSLEEAREMLRQIAADLEKDLPVRDERILGWNPPRAHGLGCLLCFIAQLLGLFGLIS
jgi:hypothetical protein